MEHELVLASLGVWLSRSHSHRFSSNGRLISLRNAIAAAHGDHDVGARGPTNHAQSHLLLRFGRLDKSGKSKGRRRHDCRPRGLFEPRGHLRGKHRSARVSTRSAAQESTLVKKNLAAKTFIKTSLGTCRQ